MRRMEQQPYEAINFSRFSEVPEEVLTEEERNRVLDHFFQTARQTRGKGRIPHRMLTAAACLFLILCLLATPMGDKALAAAKQAAVGIGQFLGMEQEDNYATVIDETRTIDGVTLTLHDVIASDHEFRCSVTGTKADGTALTTSQIGIETLWIDGKRADRDMEGTGWGPFGSSRPELAKAEETGLHFYSHTYNNYEMPVNPVIRLELYAGGKSFQVEEPFVFEFVLRNQAFKQATRRIPIGKTLRVHGKKLVLGDLIVSPIDQHITLNNMEEVKGDLDKEGAELYLKGTDDGGTEVLFLSRGGDCLEGSCLDDSGGTYELRADAKSYTLHPECYLYPEKEEEEGRLYIGRDEITIPME